MKVEINHLTKVIQGNVVLDDINACFSCASGENGGRIYGIQGINGSGKTMLRKSPLPSAKSCGWLIVAFYDDKGRQHFLLSPLDYPFAKPGGAVNGGL